MSSLLPSTPPPVVSIDESSETSSFSPEDQLFDTLRTSITSALATRRPILTHLNADTTWLISLPYPSEEASSATEDPGASRKYYHILIDPWLKGGQSDVAKFFSQQWHKEESSVQTIAEVEDVIKGIEEVAHGESASRSSPVVGTDEAEDSTMGDLPDATSLKATSSSINAVLISHEFTDHMHKETLLEIASSVPVFATSKAAAAIRSWSHFDSVYDIPRFEGDWRASSTSPLPSWVGVSRVAYPGPDLLYYHSAIMVTFAKSPNLGAKAMLKAKSNRAISEEHSQTEAEAIIYTPHGISPENVVPISTAYPKIHTLALLHGLQDIQIKARFAMEAQLNKGAHNGLKVQRLLGAKYWIGTHDEVKVGGGVVSWFLRREAITLKEAMEREKGSERAEEGAKEGAKEEVELGDVRFVDLRNGESLLLE